MFLIIALCIGIVGTGFASVTIYLNIADKLDEAGKAYLALYSIALFLFTVFFGGLIFICNR